VKPLVLASWEDPNGVTCVDILDLRDGTFGMSPCRRDPEDGHGWRRLRGEDFGSYPTRAAAEDAARLAAPECAP
jgi:hypothetical protein